MRGLGKSGGSLASRGFPALRPRDLETGRALAVAGPGHTPQVFVGRAWRLHHCDYYAMDLWGPGVEVVVSSESQSAPNLFPLVSCVSPPSDESLVALGCLARDFLPSSVTFSWNYKNSSKVSSQNIQDFPSVLRGGKYLASSRVLLPSVSIPQDPEAFLVCEVQHPSGTKSVSISGPVVEEQPPVLNIFVPTRESFSSTPQRTSKLICQASDFSPKQISMAWFRDGKRVVSGVSTGPVETLQSSPVTYRLHSMLTVTESEWLSQSVFTCQVEHKGLNYEKNASSLCTSNPNSPITVFAIAPSFAGIFLTKSAKLSCLVTGLVTRESLNISWTRQDGEVLKTSIVFSEIYANGTFGARGEASVCVEDWESGDRFTCTVTHTDLPSPLKQSVSKPRGIARHMPSVYVLPPAPEELSLQEWASVTCLVKGFSPADVFVQWLQKGEPVSADKYVTSAPVPEPEPKAPASYFVQSVLTVSAKDWSDGETYTCVVGHEALPHTVTERTVDKSTEGEVSAEEEGFENLNTMASTFIVLFLLSLFYSTTVTLFKSASLPRVSSPSSPASAPRPMRAWWPWAAWPGTSCPAPSPSPGTTRTAARSAARTSRTSRPS
uniref:Ig mu chain C region n=1 Tax=Sus scrofa TaxID=9823 RepID=A0A8D0S7U9_PIG